LYKSTSKGKVTQLCSVKTQRLRLVSDFVLLWLPLFAPSFLSARSSIPYILYIVHSCHPVRIKSQLLHPQPFHSHSDLEIRAAAAPSPTSPSRACTRCGRAAATAGPSKTPSDRARAGTHPSAGAWGLGYCCRRRSAPGCVWWVLLLQVEVRKRGSALPPPTNPPPSPTHGQNTHTHTHTITHPSS
jgi:hypothetical protein